ncbi:MAG: hypothetical protein HRT53_21045 [Colwellia sp.]|nr:hypothetical protein [Colwellia sp.]
MSTNSSLLTYYRQKTKQALANNDLKNAYKYLLNLEHLYTKKSVFLKFVDTLNVYNNPEILGCLLSSFNHRLLNDELSYNFQSFKTNRANCYELTLSRRNKIREVLGKPSDTPKQRIEIAFKVSVLLAELMFLYKEIGTNKDRFRTFVHQIKKEYYFLKHPLNACFIFKPYNLKYLQKKYKMSFA